MTQTYLVLTVGFRIPGWIYALQGGRNDADWRRCPRDASGHSRAVWRRILTIKRASARVEDGRLMVFTTDRRCTNRTLGSFDLDDILEAWWRGDQKRGIATAKWTNPKRCPRCLRNSGERAAMDTVNDKNVTSMFLKCQRCQTDWEWNDGPRPTPAA